MLPSKDFNPIEYWHSDPLAFVDAMWPEVILDPWQEEFLLALCNKNTKKDRIAVRSGHGVGKTSILGIATLWFLLTRLNSGVLIVANSQDQLKDNNWSEMRRWISKMPPMWGEMFEVQAMHVKCTLMGSFATGRTASRENPEAIQGFRGESTLIIVDEASGVPDLTFESGMGSLSMPGTKLVLTGNPTRGSGYFYDAFNALDELFHCMHVPSYTVKRATGHIEDIRKKYGENSNPWRVRVEGEFPRDEDDSVVPRYLCDDALRRKVDVIKDAPIIWGVDVAEGVGRDRTALVKRKGNGLVDSHLKPIQTWLTKDPMQISGILFDEYNALPKIERPFSINIDTIGIGAGLYYRCKELGLPAKKVNVSESASSKDRYVRLRDELWFEAREWFEGQDVTLEDNEDTQALITELCLPRYQISSAGKMRVESKQELKKRGIDSPDIAEAFLMTLLRHSNKARTPLKQPQLAII
jgi:phage terminase large subunit